MKVGLVQRHGYSAEEHNVTTEDGYNLLIHRIPDSPAKVEIKKKPVVFLQHGVMASSDSWVLFGPRRDLAFLLADAGYDVWVGNIRGNTYTRSHIELSASEPEFWKFSYHEMSQYDIPAMIDYILKETEVKSLVYIGHSMGTTIIYALLSTKPEYNDKIKLIVSLAPIVYWKQPFTNLIKIIVDNTAEFENIFKKNGIWEILPQSTSVAKLVKTFCEDKAITQPACISLIFLLSGSDIAQLNTSLIPYVGSFFPAGVSLFTLSHYYQNIVTGKFQQYDFGYVENFARYAQKSSPEYDMKRITAPSILMYGQNDAISLKKNIMELENRLSNVIVSDELSYRWFTHLDFLWGSDSKMFLYDKIIELLEKYGGKN
ncbi:lipase 3 isoform X2 [Cephus cinctus]|uniref:Lipase n=1 Tax=Cephus cinctus TaxID=211228 RepID=A0AAJ7C6H5_CEPCN|nr:lipase 3 isoform X2 [Cephus cinctus]